MELELKITADASQAKRELASVESGIKQVEKASEGTESTLTKVTKALSGQHQEAKNVVQSTQQLTTQTKALSGESDKLTQFLKDQQAWSAKFRAETSALDKQLAGLTSTTVGARAGFLGLSTATVATTAAFTAVGAVALAGAAVIVKSTKHYFDHADATRDSRKALDEFGQSWDAFQMMVGGAVLGDNFSIAAPMKAVNASLVTMGALLAARISEYQYWLSLVGSNPMDSLRKVPDVMPGTFSGQGLQMYRTGLATYTGGMRATPAYEAQGAWDESQREMKKAAKEAEAAAKRLQAFYANIAPDVTPGMWSGTPFSHFSDVPLNWSLMGPGTTSGLPSWLAERAGMRPNAHGQWLPDAGLAAPDGFFVGAGIPDALWASTQTGVRPNGVLPRPGFFQGGGPGSFQSIAPGLFGYLGAGGTYSAGQYAGAGFARGGVAGYLQGGLGMLSGAQNFWEATSQGSTGSRALSGLTQGAALGSVVPGIGTAIGAGVGALIGAIRGWLAPTEYEQRVRQEAKDRIGAGQMLETPGLASMWNSLGGNTPFSFEFLKTQAYHDPTAVKGYLDEMLEKHEKLNAAMERYGISWEDLGEQAKQSHIDEMAKTLIEDFEVLTLAGADVDFVIGKMGASVNEFVGAALRTGSEVPAAMKPMIDRMIEMGLLTDENGDAFTSLEDTGITFAKTMTQGFADVSQAIEHLAIALGYVPDKLDDITDAAHEAGDALNGMPAGPYYGGNEQPEYAGPPAHTGGFIGWDGRVHTTAATLHRGGEVPILAQSGEFMMSRRAVQTYGLGTMHAMNRGAWSGAGSDIYQVDARGSVIASDVALDQFVDRVGQAIVNATGRQARLRLVAR